MARRKMAIGGSALQNLVDSRRKYWFDEKDGMVEYTQTPEEDITPVSESQQAPTATNKMTAAKPTAKKKNNNTVVNIGAKKFSTAFKQARVAGLDKFKWNGKVYGTRLAGESGKTTKEKAANATKPADKKSNKTSQTRSTTSKRPDLNNPKDAVRVPYSRDRQGRIHGQLPNVTVTGQGTSPLSVKGMQRGYQSAQQVARGQGNGNVNDIMSRTNTWINNAKTASGRHYPPLNTRRNRW